jgi:DNA-binding NtrC family response regulator
MLRRHDFDVIVSDQRMPGMIGSEFLRQACEVSPRAMRILLTGYSDMQALLKSINEGEVFRFVSKPWKNEELSRTVHEAAEIARTQPASLPAPLAEAGGGRVLLLDDDPAMAALVEQVLPPGTGLSHAATISEAVAVLDTAAVSVLVSETRVARADTTPLLKLLKAAHPEIVSVVLTVDSDVDAVVKLINQGQVYRFVPKPVKPGFLKLLIGSALQKQQELQRVPGALRRHAVEHAPDSLREQLFRQVEQESARLPSARAASSLLARLGLGMRRLFAA